MGLPESDMSSAWQEATIAEKMSIFARDSSKMARLSQPDV
jgi:hypothetical protein